MWICPPTNLQADSVHLLIGIPGDFILPFFRAMVNSEVSHIAACNELNTVYAADRQARLKGLGVS